MGLFLGVEYGKSDEKMRLIRFALGFIPGPVQLTLSCRAGTRIRFHIQLDINLHYSQGTMIQNNEFKTTNLKQRI